MPISCMTPPVLFTGSFEIIRHHLSPEKGFAGGGRKVYHVSQYDLSRI